jgi:hypothetical protein
MVLWPCCHGDTAGHRVGSVGSQRPVELLPRHGGSLRQWWSEKWACPKEGGGHVAIKPKERQPKRRGHLRNKGCGSQVRGPGAGRAAYADVHVRAGLTVDGAAHHGGGYEREHVVYVPVLVLVLF